MKRFIFLLSSFLMMMISSTLVAQNVQEVIHLKNGSVIKGTVIEQIPGQTIKIQTADESIFVYRIEEVEKITKEVAVARKRSRKAYDILGYRGFADVGLTVGGGEEGSIIEFSTSHGYQFNPYIFAGMGVGAHILDGDFYLLPIFANARVSFIDGPVSPFLDMRAGYSISVFNGNGSGGGLYLSPMFGVRFMLGKSFAMNFSTGYSFQSVKISYPSDYGWIGGRIDADGLTIRLGFEF